MNTVITSRKKKRNASSARIFRLALGGLLVGASIWGIVLCRDIFRGSVGPGSLPGDSLFASLGAWAAWAVLFAPLAIGGVALVWSTLRDIGALDQFALFLTKVVPYGGIVPECKTGDPHGLESLSTEKVEGLQRTATRAATILGGLAGAVMLGAGVFGLAYLLVLSRTYPSNSIYDHFEVGRVMISFALFSGMLVFLGFTVLRRTFSRENNSWLLLLRVFTYTIVRRGQANARARRTEQNLKGTNQHRRV
jgi:hypothetical protein